MLEKPRRLNDDLAAAKADLEFAAECAATYMNRRMEAKRQMVEGRHAYAEGRATEIWGKIEIGMGEEEYPNDPPSCAREKVQAALQRAEITLERVERSIAEATSPLAQGAWIGAFRLCRDTVSKAEIGKSDWNGEPELRIVLTGPGGNALASLFARAVTENLAVRVDGGVVSEPFVAEPLQGDSFHIRRATRKRWNVSARWSRSAAEGLSGSLLRHPGACRGGPFLAMSSCDGFRSRAGTQAARIAAVPANGRTTSSARVT